MLLNWYCRIKYSHVGSLGHLGQLSVKATTNVSCQLDFRRFVSCQSKFWPFVSKPHPDPLLCPSGLCQGLVLLGKKRHHIETVYYLNKIRIQWICRERINLTNQQTSEQKRAIKLRSKANFSRGRNFFCIWEVWRTLKKLDLLSTTSSP